MSGTILTGNPAYSTYSTASFTDQERTDLRRMMGYPEYGSGNNGTQFFGYRFFVEYGTMEYRMSNMSSAEYQTARGLLAQCFAIETAIGGMFSTLNVDTAAVFKRNANELRDRQAQYTYWRLELCRFIGLEAGPGLRGGNTMQVIV